MNKQKAELLSEELHHDFKTGKRRKIIVYKPNEILGVDLIEMPPVIGPKHIKYKYILTTIAIFTKYVRVFPLRNKTSDSLIYALSHIFKEQITEKIWADHESALYSQKTQKCLKDNNVQLYSTGSELKSWVIERFNRTFKEKMEKLKTPLNFKIKHSIG